MKPRTSQDVLEGLLNIRSIQSRRLDEREVVLGWQEIHIRP
jgi:hypothetical protein